MAQTEIDWQKRAVELTHQLENVAAGRDEERRRLAQAVAERDAKDKALKTALAANSDYVKRLNDLTAQLAARAQELAAAKTSHQAEVDRLNNQLADQRQLIEACGGTEHVQKLRRHHERERLHKELAAHTRRGEALRQKLEALLAE